MLKKRFSNTERIGVNKVERAFLEDFNWIPRVQFESDVGIDMIVEVAEDGHPIGKLIALQIKSGESFFREEKNNSVIYRGTLDHLDYWLNYSLPVVIILHNPTTDITIWEIVSNNKISRTKKGWKISIPYSNLLVSSNTNKLLKANIYPPYLQGFLRLSVNKKLIKMIASNEEVWVLEIGHWINKSIGKADIRILRINNDTEIVHSEVTYIHFDIETSLQILFPWANFIVDEEYYEEEEEEDFLQNFGIWDTETKEYIGTIEDYDDIKADRHSIRPLPLSGEGEVDFYRLIFELNSLGQSFLEVNNYIEFGDQLRLFQ